jgi:hypothetical protein
MLAGFALARAANAQSTEPVCTPGATHATVYGAPNMPHAAFSATIKNSFEQTLPDGNHILHLTLMSINDDPRTGRTTMEVEDLSRTEPDPSLFAPPEGYTVEDQTPTSITP